MTKDDRFKDLSFVAGPPHFRFYAGTPLVTEDRINIGSVFILDDKVRDGLDDDEKEFLGTMGTVIIGYLRTNREASLGRKGVRLTQSVRLFGEGRVSFVLGSQATNGASKSTPAPTESKTVLNDSESTNESMASVESAKIGSGGSKHSKESLHSIHSSVSLPAIRQAAQKPHTNAERHTLATFLIVSTQFF